MLNKKLLGIAIIAYNRPKAAEICANSIINTIEKEKYDYSLICCIDQENINGFENIGKLMKLVPHKNYGVSINKSIAMYYLQNCDHMFLIEEDVYFEKPGWIDLLLNIQEETKIGLMNYCPREIFNNIKIDIPEKKYKYGTIIFSPFHIAQIMSITKDTFNEVGILNPKFKGYGYGHCEYTKRCFFANKIINKYNDPQIVPFVKELWDYLKEQNVQKCYNVEEEKKGILHNEQLYNSCNQAMYISPKEIEPYLPESIEYIKNHLNTLRFWSEKNNKL